VTVRSRLLTLAAVLTSLPAPDARAADRGEASASLGYAVPAGSLERGSRVSDTAFGAVPVQLDGAFFVTPRLALRLSGAFALAIPKLCASASDCTSSLGKDIAIDAGVRFALPDVGPFAPRLDAGIGWEWYATTLSDKGVSSTRAYAGPTFAAFALSAPFRLSRRFTLGPSLGMRAGVFTSSTRTTPSWTDSSLNGAAVHGWFRAGVGAQLSF
jgi:hypothetical protein